MRYITFSDTEYSSYDIAILIKPSSFETDSLKKFYVDELERKGINPKRVIAYTLEYFDGKVKAKPAKEYLKTLLPVLEDLKVKYLYVADAAYFKLLTGESKAETHLGYEKKVKNYNMKCTFGINYSSLIYNPDNLSKLNLSLETFQGIINDSTSSLGANIIKSADYIYSENDFDHYLTKLHNYDSLTVDIETTSLKFWEAKIVTIGFAINQGEGIVFWVGDESHKLSLIKQFLSEYKGNTIYHNGSYDLKVLIYNLFMESLGDTKGILQGIETIAQNIDDTKIIAYLAKNSTVRPSYSLKDLAYEFAGNYAIDTPNLDLYDQDTVCKYNLIDCLSTWFVYDTYYPVLEEEEGLVKLYKGLMLDSLRLLLQVELTGMPINMERVKEVKQILQNSLRNIKNTFDSFNEIKITEENIRKDMMDKKNATIKKKQHTIDMYKHINFNPNSYPHLVELLYNVMQLPVIDLTKNKSPATDKKALEKLLNYCTEEQQKLINALIQYSAIEKILTSFIPAMENATKHEDGYYLHGNFNIGGTASGRLSSSNPNLQNLPSGSKYGKLIKSCFGGHSSWVMCGADFASLEDRINALLTKDSNKLKVYTDNYDGHSLRAYAYYTNQMPNIRQIDTVRCFECDGIRFTENDEIIYQGKSYTGLNFYNLFKEN